MSEPRGLMHALDPVLTFPARRPIATLLLCAGILLAAFLGTFQLRSNPSLDAMFPREDPAARAMIRILDGFGAAEEMLLLASLPPDDRAPDVDRLIRFAQRLERDVQASPDASLCGGFIYKADPDARRFIEQVLAPSGIHYLNDADFESARQRLTPAGIRQQLAKNEALLAAPGPAAQALAKATLQDPLRLYEFILPRLAAQRPFATWQNSEYFIPAGGRSLLIRIRGAAPVSNIEYAKQFTAAMQTAADRANTDHLSLAFAGAYPIATASEKAIRSNMIASVTSSMVMLQLLFIALYRMPVRLFILAFLPVAAGVLCGFGFQSLWQPSVTPLTAVIGAILAGLAIDYSIHVLSHYDARRRHGVSASDAALSTLRDLTPAMSAAWLTSVIGFIAITRSSIPVLREFAVLGSVGLSGAFLGSLTLLPALLVLTDRRPQPLRPLRRFDLHRPLAAILAHRKTFLAVSLLLVIASIALLAFSRQGVLPLEHDLTVMHPRPNAPLVAQREIARQLGASPDPILIHMQAPSPQALLTLSHQVRDRLIDPQVRREAGIVAVSGIADLLPDPRLAPSRHRDLTTVDANAVVADFRAAVADSIFEPAAYEPYADFLARLLTPTPPPNLATLCDYPGIARLFLPRAAATGRAPATEALTFVFPATTLDTRTQRQTAVTAVRQALRGLDGVTLTGMDVLSLDAEAIVHRDLPRLFSLAAIAVAAYLILHFRRLRPVLLSLLPTLAAVIILLAAMRLADMRLNLINLVTAPLLLGIGVDYGIFVASLGARASREALSHDIHLHEIEVSGHGILACAASTILGFGSLYFTSVPAIQSLGFAIAIGVTACYLFTFILLLPLQSLRSA